MIILKKDGMLIKFVRSIQQKVGIEFPSADFQERFQEDTSMDGRAGSGRQQTITIKKMKTLLKI